MSYKIITLKKVGEFVDSLDDLRRARVDRIYYHFEQYGGFLPSKYLKKIGKNIWELRPGDIRLFLTIKGRIGIIVHGIYKKTQKTPKKDFDLALKRIREIA